MVDKAKQREIILECAAMLAQEKSGAPLHYADIAEAADLDEAEIRAHFPHPQDLVQALLKTVFNAFLESVDDALGNDDTPGAWLRAYIEASFPEDHRSPFTHIASSMLSTTPFRHEIVSPIQDRQQDIHYQLANDGIDPVDAAIFRAAIDGIWMGDMFGIQVVPEDMRPRVLERLKQLARLRR